MGVLKAGEPRTEKMAMDQDWTAVYPSATPFRHGSVPLPVRMGYPVNKGVPPEKIGNLELLKVSVHDRAVHLTLSLCTSLSAHKTGVYGLSHSLLLNRGTHYLFPSEMLLRLTILRICLKLTFLIIFIVLL